MYDSYVPLCHHIFSLFTPLQATARTSSEDLIPEGETDFISHRELRRSFYAIEQRSIVEVCVFSGEGLAD